MYNIAGTPVEGENFYGRDAEVRFLAETLTQDDVLLLGPRRIGKTSIARAVMSNLRMQGWNSVEINVAACSDERSFLDKLQQKLAPEMSSLGSRAASAITDAFAASVSRIKSIKVPVPGAGDLGIDLQAQVEDDWTKVGSELLTLISKVEQQWLIYVDELPIMLFNIIRRDRENGVSRVRRFLDWFRNDIRGLPGSKSIHWLISGSVGLDTLVQQHGMADTINSFRHETLDAFEIGVATKMLEQLSVRYSIKLTADDAIAIVSAIQWPQPYYLQTAFNHLRILINNNPSEEPSALIHKAIDRMLQPGSDNDFHHWETRLSQQLNPNDAALALAMLKLAAQNPDGEIAEILLESCASKMTNIEADEVKAKFVMLRDILIRDAYWWADASTGKKRYRFRLEPLRRWWIRRNEL